MNPVIPGSDKIRITLESSDSLKAYSAIPISFRITEVLDTDSPAVSDSLLPFASKAVEPASKDYDAGPGSHPLDWPKRFDVHGWGFLAAYSDDVRVGGVVVAAQCPDVDMLEGRDDLALVWDIRVIPSARNHGVGASLLAAAESWATARGARVLKVETQNNNVPACRFYARHGFVLRDVNRKAYPELPDEVQLLWYKNLA